MGSETGFWNYIVILETNGTLSIYGLILASSPSHCTVWLLHMPRVSLALCYDHSPTFSESISNSQPQFASVCGSIQVWALFVLNLIIKWTFIFSFPFLHPASVF